MIKYAFNQDSIEDIRKLIVKGKLKGHGITINRHNRDSTVQVINDITNAKIAIYDVPLLELVMSTGNKDWFVIEEYDYYIVDEMPEHHMVMISIYATE